MSNTFSAVKKSLTRLAVEVLDPRAGDYRSRRLLIVYVFSFAAASLIVFGTGVQNYVDITMRRGEEASFWRVLRWPAVWWYSWALIAPFFFELAWRMSAARRGWFRTFGILMAGNVISFFLDVGLQLASMMLPVYQTVHPTFADAIQYHIIISLYLNVFIYWSIVGSAYGLRVYLEAQRAGIRAAQLESELARARLDALKMQLHPHFLFNTLHSISALIYRDVSAADTMITRLSRLLRRALDRSDVHEITLREEVDFLKEYIAIEKVRFGDELKVDIEIDEALLDCIVPAFVFQPLVENSIKHGLGPRGNKGSISIRATQVGDGIVLSVTDDGEGMTVDGTEAFDAGVGLSNLKDRLHRLYDGRSALDLVDGNAAGLRVDVTVPFRRSSRETAS